MLKRTCTTTVIVYHVLQSQSVAPVFAALWDACEATLQTGFVGESPGGQAPSQSFVTQ